MGKKKQATGFNWKSWVLNERTAVFAFIGILKLTVDFNAEKNIKIAQTACFFALALMMLVWGAVYVRIINAPNAKDKVYVTQSQLHTEDMDYFGVPKSREKEKKFPVTVAQYDKTKWLEVSRRALISVTISTLISLFFNAPVPLLLVMFTQAFTLYRSPLFKVYVFAPEGDKVLRMKRPWPIQQAQLPFAGPNSTIGKTMASYREQMEVMSNPDYKPAPKQTLNRKQRRLEAKKGKKQ